MTFGDKTKKPEQHIYQPTLEVTGHISFHVTGPDVDKIDWHGMLENLQEEFNFVITGGNVNIYYTQDKTSDHTAPLKKGTS